MVKLLSLEKNNYEISIIFNLAISRFLVCINDIPFFKTTDYEQARELLTKGDKNV